MINNKLSHSNDLFKSDVKRLKQAKIVSVIPQANCLWKIVTTKIWNL